MIDLIKEKVTEKLKNHPNRLAHVFGVYETALKLASAHHVDLDKAAIAALYHDYAKYDPIEKQVEHLELKIIKQYANYPVIFHAYAAARELIFDFEIKDEEILNAIRHHVWGRPNMSDLEKIIFIADCCEPNRKFPDITYIYDLAIKDLNQATLYCMEAGIKDLQQRQIEPSIEQLEAFHYYKEVNCGETQ